MAESLSETSDDMTQGGESGTDPSLLLLTLTSREHL